MFKVLVVDDDSGLRLTVTSALGEANYSVDQAQDGEEAVNKVRAIGYNLVLLDVNMPRMNGMECLKQIKSYDPSIVVIMLTAYSNVRDAIEATKEGAYNYLEKPIKAENLVYMIDRALKAQSMVKSIPLSAPVVKLPNGKQNQIYGEVEDGCLFTNFFATIAKRVGPYLNDANWMNTVDNFGPIDDTSTIYASIHQGKYDADDTYGLVSYDPTIGEKIHAIPRPFTIPKPRSAQPRVCSQTHRDQGGFWA